MVLTSFLKQLFIIPMRLQHLPPHFCYDWPACCTFTRRFTTLDADKGHSPNECNMQDITSHVERLAALMNESVLHSSLLIELLLTRLQYPASDMR